MKPKLILFILLKGALLSAQRDSAILDRNFLFKDGIYTCFNEMIQNSPKYPDAKFGVRERYILRDRILYLTDSTSKRTAYKDSLFAIVRNGKMAIRFYYDFRKLILLGSISTFMIEPLPPSDLAAATAVSGYGYSSRNRVPKIDIYYLDVSTGLFDELELSTVDKIFEKDTVFYKEFSSISKRKRKKSLYYYVQKYNERNPTYIRK